jgi:transcriptional regulator with XRE-family HTH domain
MPITPITSAQIRAGRALLRWSAADLSRASGVSLPTIKRLELGQGVPSIGVELLAAIQASLEGAGVQFLGEPDRGPGVCLDSSAVALQPRPRGIRKK